MFSMWVMRNHYQDHSHSGCFDRNVCLTLHEKFHRTPKRYLYDVLTEITNAVGRSHISGMLPPSLLRELRRNCYRMSLWCSHPSFSGLYFSVRSHLLPSSSFNQRMMGNAVFGLACVQAAPLRDYITDSGPGPQTKASHIPIQTGPLSHCCLSPL